MADKYHYNIIFNHKEFRMKKFLLLETPQCTQFSLYLGNKCGQEDNQIKFFSNGCDGFVHTIRVLAITKSRVSPTSEAASTQLVKNSLPFLQSSRLFPYSLVYILSQANPVHNLTHHLFKSALIKPYHLYYIPIAIFSSFSQAKIQTHF